MLTHLVFTLIPYYLSSPSGKVSKKKNAELAAERQAIEKAMEGSAEAIKTKAVLEEYKVRRFIVTMPLTDGGIDSMCFKHVSFIDVIIYRCKPAVVLLRTYLFHCLSVLTTYP